MSEPMSDERLAELKAYHHEYGINGTTDGDSIISELLDEVDRARGREAALVDGVDERAGQLRRMGAELSRCANLNRDLVATNTNLTETAKEAREQIRRYRELVETGEPELEWGVRATVRATGRTEDISQPSEESARGRVAHSNGASVLICRTKAGPWREAEQDA